MRCTDWISSRHHARAFAGLLALSPTTVLAAEVRVDPSEPIQTLGPQFHGINFMAFQDAAQGSDASATALAQTPVGLVRFPGGSAANWYDWRCPYYQEASPACPDAPTEESWSRTSPGELWTYAQRLSAVPLYQTNIVGNPTELEGVGTPEHAAEWARWATENGIPARFEIVHEAGLDLMPEGGDAVYASYVDAFIEQTVAIRQAAPGTFVMGPGATNEWFWRTGGELEAFLEQVGDVSGTGDIDGVSLHYFFGDGWEGSRGAAQRWLAADGPWTFVRETIETHSTVELPVFMTEWHLGAEDPSFNATVGNALATADLIGAFAASGVAGHVFFCIHGARLESDAFGLLSGADEGVATDTPTPAYYAYALWSAMGSDVFATTLDVDAETTLSAWGTGDASGFQVMAINKTPVAQPLSVAIDGIDTSGFPVVVHTLASVEGPEALDVEYNGVVNPDPSTTLPPGQHAQATATGFETVVPPYAIVVIQLGEPTDPGTESGTDTADPSDTTTDAGEETTGTSTSSGTTTAESTAGTGAEATSAGTTMGTTGATTDPATGGGATNAGTSTTAGSEDVDASGETAPAEGEDSGGCACTTSPTHDTPWTLLALGVAAPWVRRRRRAPGAITVA